MLPARKAVRSRNKRRGEVAAAIGLDVCMIDLANALPAEATGCGRSSSDVKVMEVETNRRYCCIEEGKVP